MNIKRTITTGGLAGAAIAGVMALTGPAAHAATTAPAQTACDTAVANGLHFLESNGLDIPNPPSPANVYDNLIFYEIVLPPGEEQTFAYDLALSILDECSS
jgi:hypothetical protein